MSYEMSYLKTTITNHKKLSNKFWNYTFVFIYLSAWWFFLSSITFCFWWLFPIWLLPRSCFSLRLLLRSLFSLLGFWSWALFSSWRRFLSLPTLISIILLLFWNVIPSSSLLSRLSSLSLTWLNWITPYSGVLITDNFVSSPKWFSFTTIYIEPINMVLHKDVKG